MELCATARPTIVIVSAVHDYRMARRGSIQAVADAFVRQGYRCVFLSVRFSTLSLMKRDPRGFLRGEANKLARHGDVECYLWRTPLHPFETGSELTNRITAVAHDLYASWPNGDVDQLFQCADVVMVESGLSIVLIPRIRRLNPEALIVYRGSDDLEAIGAHPDLQRRLKRAVDDVDHFCLLARGLARRFAFARDRTFCVPQGIRSEDFADPGHNPYGAGVHAVSFGPTLFDATFFDLAGPAFPDITFHVVGCGAGYRGGANVRVYDEMPFKELVPYVAHADIGIAPYRPSPSAAYLAESSLKLTQFAMLRRPAVCPHFAVGAARHRFGYSPGDAGEIAAAIRGALSDRFETADASPLSWDDLVPRFLSPGDFADTAIPDAFFASTRSSASGGPPEDDRAAAAVKRATV
jgi:2-beta-glucuronyltransferase